MKRMQPNEPPETRTNAHADFIELAGVQPEHAAQAQHAQKEQGGELRNPGHVAGAIFVDDHEKADEGQRAEDEEKQLEHRRHADQGAHGQLRLLRRDGEQVAAGEGDDAEDDDADRFGEVGFEEMDRSVGPFADAEEEREDDQRQPAEQEGVAEDAALLKEDGGFLLGGFLFEPEGERLPGRRAALDGAADEEDVVRITCLVVLGANPEAEHDQHDRARRGRRRGRSRRAELSERERRLRRRRPGAGSGGAGLAAGSGAAAWFGGA